MNILTKLNLQGILKLSGIILLIFIVVMSILSIILYIIFRKQLNRQRIREILMCICKYFVLFVAAVILFVAFLKGERGTNSDNSSPIIDITLNLVPMIVSVIGISLSLQNDKILGLKVNDFRRIRKDFNFGLEEMMIISVIIFGLSILSIYLKIEKLNIMIDMISVIYSIIFIEIEIPILCKNEKRLEIIVAKSLKGYSIADYNGNLEKGAKINIVLQNLVLNNGIKNTFQILKKYNKIDDDVLFDDLITLELDYYEEYNKSKQYVDKNTFRDVVLYDAILNSLTDLFDIFSFEYDFNINTIQKKFRPYKIYLIMQSVYDMCIYKKTESLFEKKIINFNQYLLSKLELNINKETDKAKLLQKESIQKFIIYSIENTINKDELWYLCALRDTEISNKFVSKIGQKYLIIIMIIAYYYHEVDKRVKDDLKLKIINFLEEQAKSLNSEDKNMYDLFNIGMYYTNLDNLISYLPELLNMFYKGNEYIPGIMYIPEKLRTWSTGDGVLDKYLIFDCWMQIVLSKYSNSFDKNNFENMLNKLSDQDKKDLSVHIKSNWIIKENELNITINGFAKFCKFKIDDFQFGSQQELVTSLAEMANNEEKDEIINANYKEEKDLIEINKILLEKIDNVIKENNIVNVNEKLENSKKYIYSFYSEETKEDNLLDFYSSLFNNIVDDITYNYFKNLNSNKIISINEENIYTKQKISSKLKLKSNNDFILFDNEEFILHDNLEYISTLKDNNIYLNDLLICDENAFKLEIKINKEETRLSKLTKTEIDKLINDQYTMFNGLYKYNRYNSENNIIFMNREELFKLLYQYKLKVTISLEYKITLGDNYIIFRENKEEKNQK